METFGSAEIWTLRASFMLVGTDAKADIPLPDNVRRYFFAGVTHGGGRGGFSSAETASGGLRAAGESRPSAPMRAALMKAFVAWVTKGTPMPPSRYPKIADGTLVPGHGRRDGVSEDSRKTFTRESCPSAARLRSWTSFQLSGRLRLSDGRAERQAIAAAARRQGRCGRQRSRRHQVAAADGAARHLHGMECHGVGAAQGTGAAATSAASSRSRKRRPNGSRAAIRGRRSRSGIASHEEYVQAVSKAASKLVHEGYLLQQRRRRHDQAGRGQRYPSLTTGCHDAALFCTRSRAAR